MSISRAFRLTAYSLSFILLAFIIACGGIGIAYKQKLSGKYCLQATDTLNQMSIAEVPPTGDNGYTEVIPATVFAAGWDEHFIIAKQHPDGNEAAVDFYILRVSDGKISGPLTEPSFKAMRKNLGVANGLTFTWGLDKLK